MVNGIEVLIWQIGHAKLSEYNQYILFARNCDGLNLSGSFMLMHENDYKVSLFSYYIIRKLI